MTPERELCLYCHSPLCGAFKPPKTKEGVPIADTEEGVFCLPLEYFAYHFAFHGVAGGGKSRCAMNLAVMAEEAGF
jgi:hypothetical protein